jgi:prevent-host-death family protein
MISMVKKVSITEAKNNLSALVDRLRGGSSILIVDRGQPVARLEPVTAPMGGMRLNPTKSCTKMQCDFFAFTR